MALAHFSIQADPGGGRVEVNGEDVSRQVAGFRLEAGAHQVPQLTLFLAAGGDVTGLGAVAVERQRDADGDLVASFLSAMDAQQLEKDVLLNLGALEGEAGGYTQALLQRLITIARGEW
jgi:hypothetical protein